EPVSGVVRRIIDGPDDRDDVVTDFRRHPREAVIPSQIAEVLPIVSDAHQRACRAVETRPGDRHGQIIRIVVELNDSSQRVMDLIDLWAADIAVCNAHEVTVSVTKSPCIDGVVCRNAIIYLRPVGKINSSVLWRSAVGGGVASYCVIDERTVSGFADSVL